MGPIVDVPVPEPVVELPVPEPVVDVPVPEPVVEVPVPDVPVEDAVPMLLPDVVVDEEEDPDVVLLPVVSVVEVIVDVLPVPVLPIVVTVVLPVTVLLIVDPVLVERVVPVTLNGSVMAVKFEVPIPAYGQHGRQTHWPGGGGASANMT